MTSSDFAYPASVALQQDGYLFVLPWEPVNSSGVNQVVLNLLHEFEVQGEMRPVLMIQSWRHNKPEFTFLGKQTYIRLRVRSADAAGGSLRGLAAYCLLLPVELTRLLRILKANAVATVNVHYPGLSSTSFSLLRRLGLFRGQLVLTFHGLDLALAAQARGWRRALWNWSGLQADAITTCSNALARELVQAFPDWEGRVCAIHNGLDAERFAASCEGADGIDPNLAGKRYILSVGTFEPKKGHEVLVRAFAAISQQFQQLMLVLVGGAGSTRRGLEALIAELGLMERVLFRENIDHTRMASYYRHAAVFAMPSRSEPFGIAILEAGAFNVPVVASRVGGIPEIIDSSECGILVDPGDHVQLSEALARILTDPRMAATMGNGLRRRVVQKFSWAAAYHKYMACSSASVQSGTD